MRSIIDLSLYPELRTLLSEKMRRMMYYGSKFAELIGANFLTQMGREEEVKALGPGGLTRFVGAPIETVNGFIQEGRTDMLIPHVARLTGLPAAFGDMPLMGKEEDVKYAFRAVFINRTRHAVSPPTGMQAQQVKQWKSWLINSAEPMLRMWFQDYFPSNLLSAMHYGFSRDLISGAAFGGRAMTSVSHPNMIVAGSGRVTWAGGRPGTAAYEAACEAAIDALTGAAGQTMSVAFIRNMVQEAPRCKIRPIVSKSGYPLYPIFMKDAAFNQFRQDSEYKAFAQSLAIAKMEDHPLAHLGVAVIDGAIIITDLKLWSAYTHADDALVTAGTVEYGPRPTAAQRAQGHCIANTITDLDTGDNACCILMGESALSVATGEEVEVKSNVEDYENTKGYGLDFIKSVVRNEIYDALGLMGLTAGDFYENTSSMLGVTYSPYALSYS